MALTINSIKYSIFGKYDFMEAASDIVSKLYGIFGKDKFIPNMLQMIQIEQPQNTVTKIMRPQFINEDMGCSVTCLPDRIDIEIKESENRNLDAVVEYYEAIIKTFELKINRIALNASASISITTKEESEDLRKSILNEKAYPYNENIVEWEARNVSRKKCDDLDEMVNVGQLICCVESVTTDGIIMKQIKIDTDINTLAEKKNERFDGSSCRSFFVNAIVWSQEILDNLGNI